ncbi:MAG TPA: xanthine dehydrogenase family protein molybdopterin-binding subunit [Alphaproteobacteria bacterium]
MSFISIGQGVDRKDALKKVTGTATYAAEHQIPGLVHAVAVQSTIAKGRVTAIDSRAALQQPGVLAVITHETAPRLRKPEGGMIGEDRLPLQDDRIHYDGQHIAIAMADTFEHAVDAAMLVKATYHAEPPNVELENSLGEAFEPEAYINGHELQIKRGDVDAGLGQAAVKVVQTYSTPVEHHNPLEPHATIATWRGDELTLYETTQGVMNMRGVVASAFGLPAEKVRVISPFVGGGFGCKGFVWPHTLMAAMAARHIGRPVKLVMSRQQMFSSVGHRGRTVQHMALGAAADGRLVALRHATDTETSEVSKFMEPAGIASSMLYACPNADITHKVARINAGSPTPTRAPGEATGPFALESAMDELAYELKIDPIELRIRNHADADPETRKAWSSKNLLECYRRGAEAFDWARRRPEPGSMRDGRYLTGLGMATATYPANRRPDTSADIKLFSDGRVLVRSATQDIGTGTYTILSQIAADGLGVPVGRVQCEIGDSSFPKAGVSGGSSTAASVGSAVYAAAETLRSKLIELAIRDAASPLQGMTESDLGFADSRIFRKSDRRLGEGYTDILRRAGQPFVDAQVTLDLTGMDAAKPHGAVAPGNDGKPEEPFSWHSFGAQFAEVRVDPLTGEVRVTRFVSVQDTGRVLNAKTARSQIQGGVVWGLGMALMEHTVFDKRNGRIVTRNLADYLVPVNPDVPDIEVIFIDKPDPHFNALGARGMGEIGITGVAAAVANAVFHATGRRIRDLPITPDLLV